jgi:hypothetical protein
MRRKSKMTRFKVGQNIRYIGEPTKDGAVLRGEIYPIVEISFNDIIIDASRISHHKNVDARWCLESELEPANDNNCKSRCSECKGKCVFYEEEE